MPQTKKSDILLHTTAVESVTSLGGSEQLAVPLQKPSALACAAALPLSLLRLAFRSDYPTLHLCRGTLWTPHAVSIEYLYRILTFVFFPYGYVLQAASCIPISTVLVA